MKACFFTNEYPPDIYGGAGVHVEYLSRELAKLLKLTVRTFGSQDLPDEDDIVVKGTHLEAEMMEGIPKELTYIFNSFHRCLRFFNPPFDADIVHCHTWYSHFAGIIAKIAYGIPMVLTTHSLEPLRPWKREQTGKGFDMSSWIEKQAIEMADAIIAVSSETRQDVLNHFNVSEDKIKVIPNGIDIEEYVPVEDVSALKRFGVDPEKPYVLFVGRITRQKGIIHLVDAIPYINPDLQVVLLAGAPDTQEIKEEMETHIAEVSSKRDGVFWISEMLDNPEKIQFYSHAAVFCCPSIYEPFGIINLEAMACGTPVVGTRTGGIPEIVIDGETGYLVPIDADPENNNAPRDPEIFSKELAHYINKVVEDPNKAESMGQKSRKRAVDCFSWKKIAVEVAELYEKLITEKTNQGIVR